MTSAASAASAAMAPMLQVMMTGETTAMASATASTSRAMVINPLATAVVFSNQLRSCPTWRIRTVSGNCAACTNSHAPARANETVIATLG